jgi:hypothetical protein
MMSAPTFAPSLPMPAYPAPPFVNQPPQFMNQPADWSPGMGQSPMAPPRPPVVYQPAPPAPKVRAQAPDEPGYGRPALPEPRRPVALSMPSPEQLGVAMARPEVRPDVPPENRGGPDWQVIHARLERLGATCYHVEKLPQGGCLFTCLLPTTQPNRAHRVEGRAGTEAEAVRLVLDKAEEWAGEVKAPR